VVTRGPPPPPPTVTEPPRRRAASGYHSDGIVRRGRRTYAGRVAFAEDAAAVAGDVARRAGPRHGDPGRAGRRQRSVYQALMATDDLTAEQVDVDLSCGFSSHSTRNR